MRSPEGQDFWNTGVYREIVEPERIVYTHSFADEKGNVVPATGMDAPEVTARFSDPAGNIIGIFQQQTGEN